MLISSVKAYHIRKSLNFIWCNWSKDVVFYATTIRGAPQTTRHVCCVTVGFIRRHAERTRRCADTARRVWRCAGVLCKYRQMGCWGKMLHSSLPITCAVVLSLSTTHSGLHTLSALLHKVFIVFVGWQKCLYEYYTAGNDEMRKLMQPFFGRWTRGLNYATS